MLVRPALPPQPRIGSLFTGVGGLCEFAVAPELGGRVVWFAENDPAGAALLATRWPDTPNLGDVTQVDWTTVDPVDALALGFPCQDVSHAGARAGMDAGNRSGMWFWAATAIKHLRPRLVVIENVRGLLNAKAGGAVECCPMCLGNNPDRILRALGAVLGNLADLGYDTEWIGLPASDVGAAHRRFRMFILAWPAADGPCPRWEGPGPEPEGSRPGGSGVPLAVPADTASELVHQGWPAGPGDPQGPASVGGAGRRDFSAPHDVVDWGEYAPAIRRWEQVCGQLVPSPTEPGKRAERVLSPRLVEWLMGYPPGHVTDLELSRSAMLRLLGNGVVPRQARAAFRVLRSRMDGDDSGRDAAMSVRITM